MVTHRKWMNAIVETQTGGKASADTEAEATADEMLASNRFTSDGIRLFTERQLARKIRDELRSLPEAAPDGLPAEAIEYLIENHIALLLGNIKLTELQREVYSLYLRGYAAPDIGEQIGVSRQSVRKATLRAERAALKARYKYAGLHEVYWQEVHRHIYRKPRSKKI